MATVREIAANLGVSASTVSRSLGGSPSISEDVKVRVLKEARRLGYGRTKARPQAVVAQTIGISFLNRFAWPHFTGYDAMIWAGISRAAIERRVDTTLIDLNQIESGESYQAFLSRRGVHALILRVDEETRGVAVDIAADGVEVVVVADRYDEPGVNYACYRSGDATRQAIEHLLNMGHRRIGFCRNPVMDEDHRDRLDGYESALKQAGVEIDAALHLTGEASLTGGETALSNFLSLPEPPTAIFFADPVMTVGGMRRALEIGVRVPEDLSVVGVDDGDETRKMTYPSYTAVCQDAAELGFKAANWLAHAESGEDRDPDALRLTAQAYLEVSRSTAPPPATPVRVWPNGQRADG